MNEPHEEAHSAMLTLADMIGPVSHELRNVLNNMVLKAAVVGRQVPAELRGELAEFRTLVVRASDMLGSLDRYRRAIVVPSQAIDLHATVREVIDECQRRGAGVIEEISPDLPRVRGNQADLRRLLNLLISQAAAPGPVTIQTRLEGADILLRIEFPAEEATDTFFHPFLANRPERIGLERAACQTLAQRLQATLRVEAGGEGRLAIVLTLRPAGEPKSNG